MLRSGIFRIWFFPSQIRIRNIHWQRIKVFLPKNCFMLSKIWFDIGSPDPNAFPSRIPDPGFRGKKSTGSRIRICNTTRNERLQFIVGWRVTNRKVFNLVKIEQKIKFTFGDSSYSRRPFIWKTNANLFFVIFFWGGGGWLCTLLPYSIDVNLHCGCNTKGLSSLLTSVESPGTTLRAGRRINHLAAPQPA